MLATIVVNNHNYARFLGECIDSALAQTHPSTEVVVVDDGSTDGSRAVIEGYGARVRAVLKGNGGQGSAFNAGYAVSRGDVVCFLDADDLLDPVAVATALPLLQEPGVAKAQWPLRVIDAEGIRQKRRVPDRACLDGDLRSWVVENGPLYDFHFTPSGSGTSYRRAFLERVLPMPEPPYVNGADVYLTTLAPAYGTVRSVPEPLGCYRAHGNNSYFGRALTDARLENYVRRFEANASALATHLRRQGVEPDVAGWKERNFNHVWPKRLLRARRDVADLVPAGERFVLVDGGEWGDDPIEGRHAVRYTNAESSSLADDDAAAASWLARVAAPDLSFVVVWWSAFWWLDHYPEWARRLRSRRCVVDGDHLLVFDLRHAARPGAPDGTSVRTAERVVYPPVVGST